MLPALVIALLTIWPFLERSPEVLMRRRKIVVMLATLVLVAVVGLTVVGLL
jgi:quinol-cytochrome oxidoreductase complex cytochrome b subunit